MVTRQFHASWGVCPQSAGIAPGWRSQVEHLPRSRGGREFKSRAGRRTTPRTRRVLPSTDGIRGVSREASLSAANRSGIVIADGVPVRTTRDERFPSDQGWVAAHRSATQWLISRVYCAGLALEVRPFPPPNGWLPRLGRCPTSTAGPPVQFAGVGCGSVAQVAEQPLCKEQVRNQLPPDPLRSAKSRACPRLVGCRTAPVV